MEEKRERLSSPPLLLLVPSINTHQDVNERLAPNVVGGVGKEEEEELAEWKQVKMKKEGERLDWWRR